MQKIVKSFIFMRNLYFHFAALQCRPVLRQWCLNPKEIEGKNWNCRKVNHKKKVFCASSFAKTDMNLFSGSSRFCKCPRIGNVLKPKGPKGPRALKFYQSAGFCKIYYSHFIFEVITFLRKIQNHSKKLSNYGSFSKIRRKNHYLEILKS